MPKKSVAGLLKRHGGRGKSAPVRIQIGVRVRRPKGAEYGRDLLVAAIDEWVREGPEALPEGIEIKSVTWEHSGRVRAVSDEDKIEEVRSNMLRRFQTGGFKFRDFQVL